MLRGRWVLSPSWAEPHPHRGRWPQDCQIKWAMPFLGQSLTHLMVSTATILGRASPSQREVATGLPGWHMKKSLSDISGTILNSNNYTYTKTQISEDEARLLVSVVPAVILMVPRMTRRQQSGTSVRIMTPGDQEEAVRYLQSYSWSHGWPGGSSQVPAVMLMTPVD